MRGADCRRIEEFTGIDGQLRIGEIECRKG